MKKHIKKSLILVLLVGIAGVTFADRGAGKKRKLKTVLNISTGNSLKNSILNNIKYGLNFKGSLATTTKNNCNSLVSSSLMTYQKGNTTYIIPYKSKLAVPDCKQGYAGVKLILRSKK